MIDLEEILNESLVEDKMMLIMLGSVSEPKTFKFKKKIPNSMNFLPFQASELELDLRLFLQLTFDAAVV
ncbi:hypothetical protein BpHYR1_048214 [Brachionus plicatilis]|uniref:Uncharacterized protein n=1 Tax=Brachionus plicatilis TaxID=10195 RepID=A0A3M7QJW2_BRAPC|nr:hypothetical protein BpHYR1_048214 [Brachionus plicatilis]